MKRFSLQEYLANPSQKVVTRDGKPVRILCTDAKGDYPIVGLIHYTYGDEREVPESYTENGSYDIEDFLLVFIIVFIGDFFIIKKPFISIKMGRKDNLRGTTQIA